MSARRLVSKMHLYEAKIKGTDQGISNDPETLGLNFVKQGRTFLSDRYLDE